MQDRIEARRFGQQTRGELDEARRVATSILEIWADFDEVEWAKFKKDGIWNDHSSVQAALRVIMDRNDAEAFTPQPASDVVEDAANLWLAAYSREHPNDMAYDADQMVDAYLAGVAHGVGRALSPKPEAQGDSGLVDPRRRTAAGDVAHGCEMCDGDDICTCGPWTARSMGYTSTEDALKHLAASLASSDKVRDEACRALQEMEAIVRTKSVNDAELQRRVIALRRALAIPPGESLP